MSDLLLLVAPPGDRRAGPADPARPDVVWPSTSSGATAWATRLHDEFDTMPTPPSPNDVARLASWLRTQAVGRDTIVVAEARLARYAATWATAAMDAGVPQTRLTDSAHSPGEPIDVQTGARPATEASSPSVGATAVHAAIVPRHLRLERARLWVLDRAEDTARAAVRALQR